MRVWIVATFACATLTSSSSRAQLGFLLLKAGRGGLQRRPAHIQLPLGAGALRDKSGAAFDLDLGELDLSLAPGDRRLGDRLFLPRGRDVQPGLGQLRIAASRCPFAPARRPA